MDEREYLYHKVRAQLSLVEGLIAEGYGKMSLGDVRDALKEKSVEYRFGEWTKSRFKRYKR